MWLLKYKRGSFLAVYMPFTKLKELGNGNCGSASAERKPRSSDEGLTLTFRIPVYGGNLHYRLRW